MTAQNVLGYIELDANYEIISASQSVAAFSQEHQHLISARLSLFKSFPISFIESGRHFDAFQKEDGYLLIVADLPEDKNAERVQITYLQSIIQHVPSYIYWKDTNSVYLGCNRLFALAAGLNDPNEIVGKTDFDLPWAETEAELFRQDDQQVIAGYEKLNYEETQLQADGNLAYLLASKAPLRTREGKIIGVLGVYSNITELKVALYESERAKQDAETANRAKSEFVAVVSHELRTPLNGIIGLSDLLLGQEDLPESAKEELRHILNSGKHLEKLVADLIQYSTLQSKTQEVESDIINVKALVDEVKAYFQGDTKLETIALNFVTTLDSDFIISDDKKIKQIIINLIKNGIKFTERGSVSLDIAVKLHKKQQNELVIKVLDTGVGIPKDLLKTIFEKFYQIDNTYTRKHDGLGLGLAITKEIIELLNGKINVESRPGKGTTFTARIPVEFATNVSASRATAEVDSTLHFGNILLIEDNKINSRVAMRMLKPLSEHVILCEDGRQTVQAVKNNQFDIILTDISLPDISGTDLAKKIRKTYGYKNTPIIAITAHTSEVDKENFFRAGIDDVIFKPITKQALQETLARWG